MSATRANFSKASRFNTTSKYETAPGPGHYKVQGFGHNPVGRF